MENEQISIIDLVIETHAGLERQGPGSSEMTIKALSFLENTEKVLQAADLGCGSGGQTMVLARHLKGTVTGLDLFPEFVNILNETAERENMADRVKGIAGSMERLPFEPQSLDLIWSEGAIDNIGFENGLTYWHDFLKKDGYAVVSCPSYLTQEHPAEIEAFWTNAGSSLNTVSHNIGAMQTAGYEFIAAFALPEKCWTTNYFIPREAALKTLLEKYAGNSTVEAFVADNQYEVDLYAKYSRYYGYVFYIGRKL